MRFTKVLPLAAVVAGLGLAGCNPSDFNSVLDKAPVLDLGIPGSSSGALFVLPLPAPDPATKVAARMLVSNKTSNYLALADYDMNGKATLHEASEVEAILGSPVYSSAMRADGAMIVGTPSYPGPPTPGGKVSTLLVGSKADGSPMLSVVNSLVGSTLDGDGHMGISVAAGFITNPSAGDFVAVSDRFVRLVGTDPPPGNPLVASSPPSESCPALSLGSATDFYAFRPVVVADLLAGGFDEIVLGGQVGGQGPGQVVFVQYDGSAMLPCPKKILTLSPVASFGTSLAAGDFDGDGHMDLAVGAPPNHVYVYFGPLDAAVTFDVDIVASTATQFGKQLATYQVPGQATQLLVADPMATPPGAGAVGTVMLFNVPRGVLSIPSTAAVATLFNSNKDSDPGLLGLNLGGVQFNTGLCHSTGVFQPQLVPWASLGPNLLTFFGYSSGLADPRCFAQP
jgi:hypothetical protein